MGTRAKKIRRPRGLWLLTLALLGIWAVCTVNAFQTISNQAGKLRQTPVTVVLDAGHGGEDGGASSADGALEKDLNLAIAQRLRPMLESSGFRVVMIRDSDISVGDEKLETVRERKVSDLHNRLHMVEAEGECILLSIHQNHFSESQYHGTQIFYSPNVPESADLAQAIQDSVKGLLQPENSRECKPAGSSIYLLWNAQVPAVIIECGFLSNPSEAQMLQEPAYQGQMAFAIWNGFMDYLDTQNSLLEEGDDSGVSIGNSGLLHAGPFMVY